MLITHKRIWNQLFLDIKRWMGLYFVSLFFDKVNSRKIVVTIRGCVCKTTKQRHKKARLMVCDDFGSLFGTKPGLYLTLEFPA